MLFPSFCFSLSFFPSFFLSLFQGDNILGDYEYWYNKANNVDNLQFAEAEAYCQTMDAHLVSIHTKAENDFVFGLNPLIKAMRWVGATRVRKAEGEDDPIPFVWEWTDGTDFDLFESGEYTCIANYNETSPSECLFRMGEPNDYNGNDDCMVMGAKNFEVDEAFEGQWNDGFCFFDRQFACKRAGESRPKQPRHESQDKKKQTKNKNKKTMAHTHVHSCRTKPPPFAHPCSTFSLPFLSLPLFPFPSLPLPSPFSLPFLSLPLFPFPSLLIQSQCPCARRPSHPSWTA